MAATPYMNQEALSGSRASICFVYEKHARNRRYTQQLQSVVLHAKIKVGGEYLSIPQFLVRLRDRHYDFDESYDILFSYFCHELVNEETYLLSPESPSDIKDIKDIKESLREIDIDYMLTYIRQIHTEKSVCCTCICNMALMYMKTVLEYNFMRMKTSMDDVHKRKARFGAPQWMAAAIFNHDTPFPNNDSIHCYILHRLYKAMLEEEDFFTKVVALCNDIDKALFLHIDCSPTEDMVDGQLEDAPHSKACALDFILEYMNYTDRTRSIYWAAAYLAICRYAHANQTSRSKRMASLVSPLRRKRRVPFFFTDPQTYALLFYSVDDEAFVAGDSSRTFNDDTTNDDDLLY